MSNNQVLLVAEHDNTHLASGTLNVIQAAQKLGDVNLLIAGHRCTELADKAKHISGVNKILVADHRDYQHPVAEVLAPLVIRTFSALAQGEGYLLAAASTFGKDLMPRVSSLIGVSQVSDITGITNGNTFVRPIYAGNLIETLVCDNPIKVITVRVSAFGAVAAEGGDAVVDTIEAVAVESATQFLGEQCSVSERPELTAARAVVSGGRALGSRENFSLIEQLADCLGGAVGASRAAVDQGYIGNDYQVGQTGKIVAPELYIAVGISGAIQHLAGIKDSKVIVAINTDEDAPICKVADYWLQADLFEAVPELIRQLQE